MGNDNLTGGAGADVFRLPAEPWAPITVTDFTPGTDKLDLSALFQASGYTGSNPVADGYVYLQSDGAGGTLVRYDRDAAGGNPVWPNTIVDLHGVSPNGLTWAQLQGAGGAVSPPPPPPPPPPPTSPQIALATSSVTHVEGNSGVTAFSYTVTRTGDTSGASTVNWAAAGSGANPASGADFQGGTAPSGSLSFSAGQTSKTITVNVAGDTAVEPNEGFTLTLSGASGATLGTATAAGTITNDDGSTPPPSGGQLLTSTAVGSTLTGGTGNDTLVASMGNDSLTGGAGADVFRLPAEPWAPIHITDFTPGQDKIDLSALFRASGYTGSNPIADHYMYVESDGAGGSVLRFDRDAAGGNPVWPNTIIDLNIAPSQVSAGDWIIS
jgi:Ca2+-binding RTX toxin-like protein